MRFFSGLSTRALVIALVASSMFFFIENFPAAGSKPKATKIAGNVVFKQYCASCHQDGGNITIPGKPVAESKKLSTLAVFKDYLNNPVSHMPYYKNLINDEPTLKALYKYCKTLHKSDIKTVSYSRASNKI